MDLLNMTQKEIYEETSRWTEDDLVKREAEAGVFGPFHIQKYIKGAPEKAKKYLEMSKKFPWCGIYNTRQGFTGMDVNDFPPASFTAVTASATETNLWTPAIWTPIPANDMRAGKAYEVLFGGVYTSTGTQGTLIWTPRCGQSGTPGSNISLGASGAIAPTASQTAQAWYGVFIMGIRALGLAASGATATGNGVVVAGGSATVSYVMGGSVPTNVDNTAATGLIISLTISVASQSYQAQWVILRSLN